AGGEDHQHHLAGVDADHAHHFRVVGHGADGLAPAGVLQEQLQQQRHRAEQDHLRDLDAADHGVADEVDAVADIVQRLGVGAEDDADQVGDDDEQAQRRHEDDESRAVPFNQRLINQNVARHAQQGGNGDRYQDGRHEGDAHHD